MKLKNWLLFSIVFCLIFIAACSSDKNESNTSNEQSQSQEQTNNQQENNTDASGQDEELKTGIDLSKNLEMVYFRQYQNNFNEPAIDDNPVKKQLQEDLNIEFKVDVVPGAYEAFSQLLTTRVATNDLPDIGRVNTKDLLNLAEQGAIIPLNDLLELTPELRDSRTDKEWLFSTIDEKIYSVASIQRVGAIVGSYIRKDWLDNLGLKVPETTEELFDTLVAFTKDDPDQNGSNDTYGYSSIKINSITQSMFANAFGLPQMGSQVGGVPDDWIDTEGNLHFGPISDQYKDYLIFMNRLQEAGVLDPDLPTNTNQTFHQKVIQGQIGMFSQPNPHMWMFDLNPRLRSNIEEADPNAEWVILDPVKGPEGLSGHNAGSPAGPWHFVIFKSVLEEEGRAERAIALLDYLDVRENPKMGGYMLSFGVDGIHNEMVDGKMVLKDELQAMKNEYAQAYDTSKIDPDYPLFEIEFTDQDRVDFARILDNYSKGYTMVNNYYGTLPITTDYNTYIQEMALRFIYGRDDFSKWDEYVQTLNERYQYSEVQELRKEELRKLGLLK